MLVGALSASSTDREVARTQAKYERWIADRQARLNAAVAQLNASSGAGEACSTIEKRHAALALLLTDMKSAPGAAQALTPAITRALALPTRTPPTGSRWFASARSSCSTPPTPSPRAAPTGCGWPSAWPD